jgi:chromate transporter
MHRILVDEKGWVSENRFLHALNYCMLLPGPEAQQLAIYIGWLLHRTLGGLVAGILFVLPGFIAILALSILYAGFQDLAFVQALFFGLKPAVLAVVIYAVHRIAGRALTNGVMIAIAAAAFVAIFFFDIPFPLIILSAALIGFIGGRIQPGLFAFKGHGGGKDKGEMAALDAAVAGGALDHTHPSLGRAIRIALICLGLWFAPLLALVAFLGGSHIYVQEGLFFSKMAVVTFGGAYAVLAYVAQEAVNYYGWLNPGEMLDGLGMAETTPGPLIQVVQFVGFMGAYRNPDPFDPLLSGILASVLTTWVTFVPCFLWIFLGAPYIERLRENRALTTALSGITAAVVGVILNLAVWFALNVIFGQVDEVHRAGARLYVPVWNTVDPASLALAIGALLALFWFRIGMIPTLAGSAALGIVYHLAL